MLTQDRSTAPVERSAAAPRPLALRSLVVLVLLLGLGGGVLTEYLQGVLENPWAAWANSVASWCVPGFAVGAVAVRPGRAAGAAVVVELLLVAGFYLSQALQGVSFATSAAVTWLAAGVAAGVLFGSAGAWWRTRRRGRDTVAVALVAGVFVSEGLLRAVRFPWQGSSGVVMVVAGLVAGLLLARTWRQRAVVGGLLVAVVPLGLLGIELVDRVLAAW